MIALIGISLLLAGQAQAAATVTFYHHDALGSVVASSNDRGWVQWNEEYQPYGEKIYDTIDTAGNGDDWYTGKNYDRELDLTYYGARWYDAKQGRFLSMDPVGVKLENVHSFNRYHYANSNPYKYLDPDGEEGQWADDNYWDFEAETLGKDARIARAHHNLGKNIAENLHMSPALIVGTGTVGLGVSAGKLLASKGAGKVAVEGIYEFVDTAGKRYCGQSCNIPNRLAQHIKSGKLDPNQSVTTTEVLGGKTVREIAEHKRIQQITGGVPARFSDRVSNKVDPIGPNRVHLLDE